MKLLNCYYHCSVNKGSRSICKTLFIFLHNAFFNIKVLHHHSLLYTLQRKWEIGAAAVSLP